MPAVKVIDKDTSGERRRALLWECFGFVGVNSTDIKETRRTGRYPQDRQQTNLYRTGL